MSVPRDRPVGAPTFTDRSGALDRGPEEQRIRELLVRSVPDAAEVRVVDHGWKRFLLGADPAHGDPSESYIDFIYLEGVTDGSVTYDAGLSIPGTYNVRLLFDDSYTVEAGSVITIE